MADDRNARAREARRTARIDKAALDVRLAIVAIEHFNELIVRDGIAIEDLSIDPMWVHKRLTAAAEQILLADVYGELDDDDTAERLLGGEY